MIVRTLERRFAETRSAWSGPWGPSDGSIPGPGDLDQVGDINLLPVSEQRALRASGVFACQQVIVDDVSTLPVGRHRSEGPRRVELDPPALFRRPLPGEIEDLPEWVGRLLQSLILRGNCYARVLDVDDQGATVADPIHPDACRPVREDGRLRYRVYSRNGRFETLDPWPAGELWHVRGIPSAGHDEGLSPIGAAMQMITLALAAETFGAQFFADGALPSSILSTEEKIPSTEVGRKRARQIVRDFDRIHRGRRRTGLLTGGTTWQAVTLAPNEAQFIETRKFQLEEIARLFRVKPHKIGILDRATFSNIESQSVEHVTDTLRPWIVRLEHGLDRLFPGAPTNEYTHFNVLGLLRGDQKTRFESYALARQWGWLSANDVLALEDQNPIGPEGDTYLQALNMADASGPSFAERINAAGILVRAGYDPVDVARAMGIPDIGHTGAIPVTVQTAAELMPASPPSGAST